jgi:iron(III) transport system substrate-binding protein
MIATPVQAAKVLNIYSGVDVPELEEWVPVAEQAIGMKIAWIQMSCTELWARLEAEAPNFPVDMVWGIMNVHALLGKLAGYYIPYKSPSYVDIPANFKDPEGYWYGWSYWFSTVIANTDLLKKKNLPKPKSWMDLAKPIYKGEVIMSNPGTSGTAFVAVSTIMQIFGEEKGWKFIADLHKNVAQYTRSGTAPAQLVAQGEYAIGIAWDQAVYTRAKQGFPVEPIIPAEGTGFDLDSLVILKGCKNLEGSQKLIDWIGSKEGQTLIGKSRSKVVRPGIPSRIEVMPKLIDFDATWSGQNQKRIMIRWKEMFEK